MIEIAENNGGKTEIKDEGLPKGIIEVTGPGKAAPGTIVLRRKPTDKIKVLPSHPEHIEEGKKVPDAKDGEKIPNAPSTIEETNLETSGAEKILLKISFENKDEIPLGLRHEISLPKNYDLKRKEEAEKAGLSEKDLREHQPEINHSGYNMGKIENCECVTLLFALLNKKNGGFMIQDAHWKDPKESQNSKAHKKGRKLFSVFVNLVPRGTGEEKRLDPETFRGIVRLLSEVNMVNPFDNRHLDKKSVVVNITQPEAWVKDLSLKNRLVLKN